jgi:hypothetical protein
MKNEKKLCDNHFLLLNSQESITKINSKKDRTYVLEHPGVVCSKAGRCGFKLKHCQQDKGGWKIDLCREEADYRDSDIHFHDVVSLDHMYHYVLISGTTDAGLKVMRWI